MSGKKRKIDGLPVFSGPFADIILQYIKFKRAQGYHLRDPYIYRLREMDLFFKGMGIEEIKITREMYEAYTKPKPDEKASNTDRRRSILRGFAKYLVAAGYDNIYTGFDDSRIFKSDFIPYIFSKEEILSLFSSLNTMCAEGPGYENDCFHTAILMYYCCGFRKAEAQNLTVRDVNLETGKITVLDGKNDVSRIVVASQSLLQELEAYASRYLNTEENDTYFLYPKSSRDSCSRHIYQKYRELLEKAAIPLKSDGSRQRLHDLRHTFCVRALEQMQEKGFDLYTSLPLLSKYLGHKHITETEYYLRLMEEHFGDILNKTSAYYPTLYTCKGGDVVE